MSNNGTPDSLFGVLCLEMEGLYDITLAPLIMARCPKWAPEMLHERGNR